MPPPSACAAICTAVRFDARPAVRAPVDEVHQDAAAPPHRSADVANQDDRARGFAALPPGEIDEITAAHQIASQHRPQVDVAAVGALPPPRSAHAQFPRELFQERRQLTGIWTEQQDKLHPV